MFHVVRGEEEENNGKRGKRKEGKNRGKGGKEENKERKEKDYQYRRYFVPSPWRDPFVATPLHFMPYASSLMPYVWRGMQALARHVRARE